MIPKNKIWRYLWGVFLLLIGFIVISSQWKISLDNLKELIRSINIGYLILLPGLQVLAYVGDGWLTKIILETAGFKVKLKDTLRVAILDVFGSHFIPIIGPSAVTYYFYRKFNIPSPSLIFLVIAWTAITITVYAVFFILSLFFLPAAISRLPSENTIFLYILGGVALLSVAVGLIKHKWLGIKKLFIKLVASKISDKQSLENFGFKFQETAAVFFRRKANLAKAISAGALFYLADVATLYVAFLAFGFKLPLPILVAGFTFSMILPIFTLIPEAPGVAETALVVSFVGLGVPSHGALLAALLFRIFAYWLPLPLGIISFFQLKKRRFNENGEDVMRGK